MTAPHATCEVFIDGTRLPDTGSELVTGRVTGLSGLSLTWGRDGQNEQPGPASLSLDLLDPAGNDNILDVLHVGSDVQVWAEARIPNPNPEYTQTMDDGSFDSYPLGPTGPYFVTPTPGVVGKIEDQAGGDHIVRLESAGVLNYEYRWTGPANVSTSEEWVNGTLGRTNLSNTPNAEDGGTGNWYSSTPARYPVSADATAPISGTYSVMVNRTADTPTVYLFAGLIDLWPTPMTAGTPYTWAMDFRTELAGRRIQTNINYSNSGGGHVGTSGWAYHLTGGTADGEVYRIAHTHTPPAGAVYAFWQIEVISLTGDTIAGERCWFDNVLIVEGTDPTYFDGNSPDRTDTSNVSGGSNIWKLVIPPRQFSPIGELPNAWDSIPQGNTRDAAWRFTVDVRATAGTQLQLTPVAFHSPYSTTYTTKGAASTPVTATGAWQTVLVDLTPDQVSATLPAWMAIQVTATGMHNGQWQAQNGVWMDQGVETWATQPAVAMAADDAFVGVPGLNDPVRRVLAFSGEISDVTVSPYGDGQTTAITATAMDLGAALGNTMIGDEPWAVETLGARATKIADLAAITTEPPIRIDSPLAALQVSYRDVDSQPAYGMLQDLAQTGGGVLWAATHAVTGPYLWIENPATREAVQQFELDDGLIIITSATRAVSLLSACDLLEEPTTWRQDTSDVLTVVAVSWLEQGVDEEMMPTTTERTETVTDPAGLTMYGTRRMSVSTELINAGDASAMADRMLAQARAVAWRLEGLQMDTALLEDDIGSLGGDIRQTTLLDLLDGTARMGMGVTLVDMPTYAPRGATSGVYVEGGKYDFTDGFWNLTLTTSPASGQGASAAWGDFAAQPAWRWNQWDPDLVWSDAFGVAV